MCTRRLMRGPGFGEVDVRGCARHAAWPAAVVAAELRVGRRSAAPRPARLRLLAPLGLLASCVAAFAQTTTVTPRQDALLGTHEPSERTFLRLQIGDRASYFHQRTIGEAVVERDFIRYQFNVATGDLLEHTRKWRAGLPERVDPAISRPQAEALAAGPGAVVQYTRLYFIAPDSHVHPIRPAPANPCWIVHSTQHDRQVVTIVDAMTGALLGNGVPPPSEGYSLSGPQDVSGCSGIWTDWYTNAANWFSTMGYPTDTQVFPNQADLRGQLQNDSTALFYELAHGGWWYFQHGCPDITVPADLANWLVDYAHLPFAFIGSCAGMCQTGSDTLSFEFRKGRDDDTVTVGYCGMDTEWCDTCWDYSVDWQNVLFSTLADGDWMSWAFDQANLAYPACADHACMRMAGDDYLFLVPHPLVRSFCGYVWDGYGGPLLETSRGYYVRCDSTVPEGETLTLENGVFMKFLFGSKLTVDGTFVFDGGFPSGGFVAGEDHDSGLFSIGQVRITNGGEIRVFNP